MITSTTATVLSLAAMIAAAPAPDGQTHGLGIASSCESPTCIDAPLDCLVQVDHNDRYGDTIEVTEAWFVIDPAGDAVRDPIVGNLPIFELIGNAVAIGPDGTLPVRLGPPGSILSGLPGVDELGRVVFGPGSMAATLDYGDPILVMATTVLEDLCDSPMTKGCFTFPHVLQFTAASQIDPVPPVIAPVPPLEIVDTVAEPAVVPTLTAPDVGATDNCAAPRDLIVTAQDPAPGTSVPVGFTPVTFTVIDTALNETGGAIVLSVVHPDVNDDGVVDDFDLDAVIAAWGLCPAPPAPCPEDVNGDGVVNVDDLVAVIRLWG